jgi:hypothetical protein
VFDGGFAGGSVPPGIALSGLLGEEEPIPGNPYAPKIPGNYPLLITFGSTVFSDSWWSPALRAQLCLPALLKTEWEKKKPSDPIYMSNNAAISGEFLKREINSLRKAAMLRPARQAEIMQQNSGLDGDWRQFLGAHQSRRPATAALVYLGLAMGTVIGMHWKRHFKAPRPAQIYPALTPIVPTPRHPSYPSNHSFQSHLIADMLAAILQEKDKPAHGIAEPAKAFAHRIARNREIAGVHFSADSEAGKWLAAQMTTLWAKLLNPEAKTELGKLVADIKAEWQFTDAYESPDQFQPYRSLADVVADKVKQSLTPGNQ